MLKDAFGERKGKCEIRLKAWRITRPIPAVAFKLWSCPLGPFSPTTKSAVASVLPWNGSTPWRWRKRPSNWPGSGGSAPPSRRRPSPPASCMTRAKFCRPPISRGVLRGPGRRWQGRQRDAGGLNDGLLLHNNSFSSGDGLENFFQYCVVYAENCFKLFGARSCRAGQRHQILDWRHRFSPAGIVCADGPLAFNPEVPQEPRAMPFKRLVWVGSSSSV